MLAGVTLPEPMMQVLQLHLFPQGCADEQGGFLLCSYEHRAARLEFSATQWEPLRPDDYVAHEVDYLELNDKARARIIKRAHDAGAALVEVHCHPFDLPACFSHADIAGLHEFVPHVRWRLREKPYGALVFGRNSVDGLAWTGESKAPIAIDAIDTGLRRMDTTGLTLQYFGSTAHA